jgi:hypothetical protein
MKNIRTRPRNISTHSGASFMPSLVLPHANFDLKNTVYVMGLSYLDLL